MRPLLLLFLTAALSAQSLLDEARAQPVEIFADVAFALIPRLSPELQISTLTEIFDRAGEARDLYPTAYPDVQALDALSLRTRAIRTLLTIDAAKGRRLFEAMARPNVPAVSCAQAEVPNAGVYMDTVDAVVRQGSFTNEEKKKGVPFAMVVAAVRGASTGAELAAAHRLSVHAEGNEAQETAMAAAFTAALSVQESDRTFSSPPPARLVGTMVNVSTFLRRTSQVALFSALRAYLVRHLTAARCELGGRPSDDGVQAFAEAVARYPGIPPLSPKETEPAKREGKPEFPAADPAYTKLQAQVRALTTASRGQDLAKLRTTPDWADRALHILSDVESWKGADERDSVDLAADKLKLLKQIVDIAPGGVLHQAAMAATLNVLGDPAFLLRSPRRWVGEIRYFMALAAAFTPESLDAMAHGNLRIMGLPYETGRELPGLFVASGSPALSLYGRLMLLQRSPK